MIELIKSKRQYLIAPAAFAAALWWIAGAPDADETAVEHPPTAVTSASPAASAAPPQTGSAASPSVARQVYPAGGSASATTGGAKALSPQELEELDSDPSTTTYALDLSEIEGLAPETAPGTVLDLWVTWMPPITKEPDVRLLIPHIVFERIEPAVTSTTPDSVIITLPHKRIPDLIYGDQFGALSVTTAT